MDFFEHKLVVEIDEKGHIDKNQNKENEKQILIFLLKLVKCKITLLNQTKKKWKANLEENY